MQAGLVSKATKSQRPQDCRGIHKKLTLKAQQMRAKSSQSSFYLKFISYETNKYLKNKYYIVKY
jgi:hypothetical protein